MPYSYPNTTMRVDVRRHAAVEGLESRYTDDVIDELFFPHYKAFRRLVAGEGHPHFLDEYEFTPATDTDTLTDSTIQDILVVRNIGVQESGGGTEPYIWRLDPVADAEVFSYAGFTHYPRKYRVQSDGTTGNVSIKVYPKPDQVYVYHIEYYAGLATLTEPTNYIFHGGWEKLPVLQSAQDIARRERDGQLLQMLEVQIRGIEDDIRRDAQRLSRRTSGRTDVIGATNRYQYPGWGRYGR